MRKLENVSSFFQHDDPRTAQPGHSLERLPPRPLCPQYALVRATIMPCVKQAIGCESIVASVGKVPHILRGNSLQPRAQT
jgi:hypothetical protein